jgi:hypothetical protein
MYIVEFDFHYVRESISCQYRGKAAYLARVGNVFKISPFFFGEIFINNVLIAIDLWYYYVYKNSYKIYVKKILTALLKQEGNNEIPLYLRQPRTLRLLP